MQDDICAKLLNIKNEAEWNLVTCLVANTGEVLSKCKGVPSSLFSDRRLRVLWEKVKSGQDVMSASNDVSPDLYFEIFKRYQNGIFYIDTSKPEEYERIMWNAFYCLDVLDNAKKIALLASELKTDDVFNAVNRLSKIVPNYDRITTKTLDKISELYKDLNSKEDDSIDYKIESLKNYIGNFRRGTLTFIAGRPGMGKTSLSLFLAKKMAMDGNNVLYFSLEMEKIRLWERMLASHAEISVKELRESPVEYKNTLSDSLASIIGNRLMINDNAYTVNEIIKECNINSPDVVIIDHVDEMKRKEFSKESTWRSEYMKELRDYAKEANIVLISALQMNRNVEDSSRNDKRPLLADLRWDGGLEQIADIVLMCYMDNYYNKVISKKVPYELWIRKNRDGENNVCVNMLYNMHTQSFDTDVISVDIQDVYDYEMECR